MTTGSNKKSSSKGNQKAKQRNLNNETILSLKRLTVAIQELDNRHQKRSPPLAQNSPPPTTTTTSATTTTTGSPLLDNDGDDGTIPLIHHWRDIPADILGAYQMLQDGAQLIKNISTKYTLLGKINLEDGSKLSTELRQGCELLSTAAFLIHAPSSGCARSTRLFVKQRCLAVVKSVTTLMESFVSLRALEGNVGAQLTGAVWQACDEVVEKTPKGNRACVMKEMFTWVKECNETMQEFEDLVGLGPLCDGENGTVVEGNDKAGEGSSDWDEFCENLGTGEQYTNDEMPIIKACLALIKCSRGIIGLSLKALECAGSAAEGNISHPTLVFQWMTDLHETCRIIGEGVTNLGCTMYPPLALSVKTNDTDDNDNHQDDDWKRTEIGKQVIQQSDWLMSAARSIDKHILGSDETEIEMSAEILDMCGKLLIAIENRTADVEHAIQQAIIGRQ